MTFERAMNLSREESSELFKKHVNPEMAGLLKLGDVDKRYSRAEGIHLFDEKGRAFMDFTAGYGALNLGHNPKEVIDAVRVAQVLPAVLLVGYTPLMGALGAALASILPGDLSAVTFGSGGAESVENALKTARAATQRKKFLSCTGGYHGLSFGALSVCGSMKFRETLSPLLEHCELVPFGDLDVLEQKLRRGDVAGFLVEPVLGEGGVVVPPKGYLKDAGAACRTYGTLLILDEIQTGFGRTGKMFAMEHEGVVPDIVILSKSLGSGVVPVSVSVTTPEIWKKAFGSREKFDLVVSTFAGNAAACAAALKTIEIMGREDIPGRSRDLGAYAKEKLEELGTRHSLIKEVRGLGLMLGIELDTSGFMSGVLEENLSVMVISQLLNKHNVLTAYCDFDPKVIRFAPPLIVTKEQIDNAIDAFDSVLAKGKVGLTLSTGITAMGRMIGR